jgi:hypothetical protein
MGARIPLPRELHTAPFAIADALVRGVGPGRLRGPDLQRPFWGVRVASGTSRSLMTRAQAYASRMPVNGFFSHLTADALWGIPLPPRSAARTALDVALPRGGVIPVAAGVSGHRLQIEPRDIVLLQGVRVTSLARTWCDLGAVLSEEDLIAAGDFLLWRKRPPQLRLSAQDLWDALDRHHGRRGRPLLRATIPCLCDRADSPPESTIRVRCIHAGLPAPAVNVDAYDARGGFLGKPDLSFPKYRVAVDYEGEVHRIDAVQWAKDLKRAPRFEDAGWSYLRAGAADYRDSHELIARIRSRLRQHGWRP